MKCLCGDVWPGCDADSECLFFECGYEWCPKCEDHHRPPVCVPVIQGESIRPVPVPVRGVLTFDGPLGLPPNALVIYEAGPFPAARYPPWTPFRNCIPRSAKCYRMASGAMVHVKPDCRC